jgi:hypothetical protein
MTQGCLECGKVCRSCREFRLKASDFGDCRTRDRFNLGYIDVIVHKIQAAGIERMTM